MLKWFKASHGILRPLIAVNIAVMLLATAACSGPTAAPLGEPVLHGEVVDPMGDAPPDERIPVSPDLVHTTASVAAGNLMLAIQFAPGTLSRQTTRVSVLLDTDQNRSTGFGQQDGLGADFSLDLNAGTGQATVGKADPIGCAADLPCFGATGSAPITFGADSMQVTLPLSLLGSDDGRMSFQAISYFMVGPLTTMVVDFMPDNALPAGRIQ
jgi:hypothetical protein